MLYGGFLFFQGFLPVPFVRRFLAWLWLSRLWLLTWLLNPLRRFYTLSTQLPLLRLTLYLITLLQLLPLCLQLLNALLLQALTALSLHPFLLVSTLLLVPLNLHLLIAV